MTFSSAQMHIEEHDHIPMERGRIVIGTRTITLTKCAFKYCAVIGVETTDLPESAADPYWTELVGMVQGALSLYVQRGIVEDPTARLPG